MVNEDNGRGQDNGMNTRRGFLRSAVAFAALGVGAGGAVAASGQKQGKARKYPLEATGRRIHKIKRKGDEYIHRERFISPDLKAVYNHPVVRYDPVRIPAEEAPEEWKEHNGNLTYNYEDTGVFGTFEQHVNVEERIRSKQSSGISIQSHGSYGGPLYQYTTASLDERKAPVNVAWTDAVTSSAEDVKQQMNDPLNGWGSLVAPSGSRYIQVRNNGNYVARQEDKHVKRQTGFTSQYHARLWDLPTDTSDYYEVVGSAHHDPTDHGKIVNPNWRFDESRGEVLKAWDDRLNEETTLQFVGNGSGYHSDGTADGNVGIVH